MLGIWTDQYGGRIVYTAVMLSAAVATWLLTFAYDYPTFLLAALGVGIAGGSFAVGIAYVSQVVSDRASRAPRSASSAPATSARRSPSSSRPFVMVAYGWQAVAQVWALGARRHGGRVLARDQGRPAARARGARRRQARAAVAPCSRR